MDPIPKVNKLTVPQFTKYERILSILAWLILFWFLSDFYYIERQKPRNQRFLNFFSEVENHFCQIRSSCNVCFLLPNFFLAL